MNNFDWRAPGKWFQYPKAVMYDPTISSTAKTLLGLILKFKSHELYMTIQNIGESLGVSDGTVRKCIRELQEKGIVTVQLRSGETSVVSINSSDQWKAQPLQNLRPSKKRGDTKFEGVQKQDGFKNDEESSAKIDEGPHQKLDPIKNNQQDSNKENTGTAPDGADSDASPAPSQQEMPPAVETAPNARRKSKPKTPTFDLDALYAMYPKKEGKKVGLDLCRKNIRTQHDYDLMVQAINNYQAKIKREQPEEKYICFFSTFVKSRWQDFTNENRAENSTKTEQPIKSPWNDAFAEQDEVTT